MIINVSRSKFLFEGGNNLAVGDSQKFKFGHWPMTRVILKEKMMIFEGKIYIFEGRNNCAWDSDKKSHLCATTL